MDEVKNLLNNRSQHKRWK